MEYIASMSTKESELLKQIKRETFVQQIYPRMISGQLQGKLLEIFSCIIMPRRILEIGTFTAYSTICLAQGLADEGKIVTIEKNPELEDTIKKNLGRAGILHRTELIIGDAVTEIVGLDDCFDLVFIDGDKEEYVEYFRLLLPKVRANGLIIADNVLWDGKVVEQNQKKDKEAEGIIRFNDYVVRCEEVDNVIIPLRDGLSLIIKKTESFH